jgi:hypothetical protein
MPVPELLYSRMKCESGVSAVKSTALLRVVDKICDWARGGSGGLLAHSELYNNSRV